MVYLVRIMKKEGFIKYVKELQDDLEDPATRYFKKNPNATGSYGPYYWNTNLSKTEFSKFLDALLEFIVCGEKG